MAIMSSVFGGDPEGTSPIEDTDDPSPGAEGTSPIEDADGGSADPQGSSPLADESPDPGGTASFDGADRSASDAGIGGDGGMDDGTAPPMIGIPVDGSGEPMSFDG